MLGIFELNISSIFMRTSLPAAVSSIVHRHHSMTSNHLLHLLDTKKTFHKEEKMDVITISVGNAFRLDVQKERKP